MATARSIITDAYEEIGYVSPSDTLSEADASFGLRRFQMLLNAWKAEQCALFLQERNEFVLTSGVNTFTIGDGGDLDTTRPVWIEGVNYIVPGSTGQTGTVEVMMAPLSNDQYMALSIKDLQSGLPQQFYYNATVPLGTMFIWPTVTQDVTLAVYLQLGMDEPATLDTVVVGPPGYSEAFLYQLAIRLCGPTGRPIPPQLPQMAASAFLRMQRPNADPGILGVDAALDPTYGGAFNVLTGNWTGSGN